MPRASKLRLRYRQGWQAAIDAVWDDWADIRDQDLTEDQQRFKNVLLKTLNQRRFDEEELKHQPTNHQLAEKYAISLRTVTNWRKAECPFEEGQWKVLDWMADQRYVPARAKAKFARQLARRSAPECTDPLEQLRLEMKDLGRTVRLAKKFGLL